MRQVASYVCANYGGSKRKSGCLAVTPDELSGSATLVNYVIKGTTIGPAGPPHTNQGVASFVRRTAITLRA